MLSDAIRGRRWGGLASRAVARTVARTVLCSTFALAGCTLKLSLDDQAKAGAVTPPSDSAVPRLVQLLTADDAQVRAVAATELGALGPKAKPAQQPLADLLNDRDRHVRFVAARALAQIDPLDPATPPTLVLIANDPQTNSDDRAAAVVALGSLGPRALSVARPALQRLSDDDDPTVRAAARTAFARVDLLTPAPATQPAAQPVNSATPVQPFSRFDAPPRSAATRSSAAPTPAPATPQLASAAKPATAPAAPDAQPQQPQDDALPKADVTTFGVERYSPAQLDRVRAWIRRQPYLNGDQQRDHIARFEQWNASQESKAQSAQSAAGVSK